MLPLSIFARFLIRLDFPAKELDILPYGSEKTENDQTVPVVVSNQLLFVKGLVNETHAGYFLLDTGAAYTAISRNVARMLHVPELMQARVPLQGGMAEIDAPLLSGSVRLQFGFQRTVTGPVVAVDLATASRYHGFEIAGLIGYSALCDSVLTANYRDNLIRIGPKSIPQYEISTNQLLVCVLRWPKVNLAWRVCRGALEPGLVWFSELPIEIPRVTLERGNVLGVPIRLQVRARAGLRRGAAPLTRCAFAAGCHGLLPRSGQTRPVPACHAQAT